MATHTHHNFAANDQSFVDPAASRLCSYHLTAMPLATGAFNTEELIDDAAHASFAGLYHNSPGRTVAHAGTALHALISCHHPGLVFFGNKKNTMRADNGTQAAADIFVSIQL